MAPQFYNNSYSTTSKHHLPLSASHGLSVVIPVKLVLFLFYFTNCCQCLPCSESEGMFPIHQSNPVQRPWLQDSRRWLHLHNTRPHFVFWKEELFHFSFRWPEPGTEKDRNCTGCERKEGIRSASKRPSFRRLPSPPKSRFLNAYLCAYSPSN